VGLRAGLGLSLDEKNLFASAGDRTPGGPVCSLDTTLTVPVTTFRHLF
jgi:hypothetical protein